MPVELGSFDAIIGMDWLSKYQAIIVCDKKIVRIPWGNETLIVHGDESNRGYEARLYIISYSKTQEYMVKGCPVFLAHVTTNEVEDKSEKKRLEIKQEHEEHLKLILELLKKEELYAKFSKCEFWIPKVLLGIIKDSLKGFRRSPNRYDHSFHPEERSSIVWVLGDNTEAISNLIKQKLIQCTILALPEGRRRFIAMRCFKEGFGAFVLYAKEKRKEVDMRQRHWLEVAQSEQNQERMMLEECWLKNAKNLEAIRLGQEKVGTPCGWNSMPQWQESATLLWQFMDCDHARVL
ncbi:hypothetical protein Tco_0488747 [Tanacetum coccineum]